jgi:DNA-binding MarR family transcriptional regulator
MDIKGRILQSLRPRRDGLLLRLDAKSFGSPSQVSAALRSLVDGGLIEKLDRGVYAKPAKVLQLGKQALLESANLRAKNLRDQIVRRRKRTRLTPTARYVRDLAKSEGVLFNRIYADRWASSVTKLAGDEVKSDSTDDLLVALTRSGKMTPKDMVALVIKHHKDLKRV